MKYWPFGVRDHGVLSSRDSMTVSHGEFVPRCEVGDGGKLKFALSVQAIDQQDEEIHNVLRIGEQLAHGDFVDIAWNSGCMGVGMPFAKIVKPLRVIAVVARDKFELTTRFTGFALECAVAAAVGLCRRFDNPEIRVADMFAKKDTANFASARAP